MYKPLREVSILFTNGDVINTNMSANVTDKEIQEYYKVGRVFNLGSVDDLLTRVKEVTIVK